MIPPEDMPANDPVVIVQSAQIESTFLIQHAKLSIISAMVKKVMEDVPDSDFIEVRAIRYDRRGDT